GEFRFRRGRFQFLRVDLRHRRRLRLGLEDALHDLLRRVQVFFQQDWRHGKDVADVVETVADVVGGEIVGGGETDAAEIPDGSVIFGAIEAPGRDAARGCRHARAGQVAANPAYG